MGKYICTKCNLEFDKELKYCPFCGQYIFTQMFDIDFKKWRDSGKFINASYLINRLEESFRTIYPSTFNNIYENRTYLLSYGKSKKVLKLDLHVYTSNIIPLDILNYLIIYDYLQFEKLRTDKRLGEVWQLMYKSDNNETLQEFCNNKYKEYLPQSNHIYNIEINLKENFTTISKFDNDNTISNYDERIFIISYILDNNKEFFMNLIDNLINHFKHQNNVDCLKRTKKFIKSLSMNESISTLVTQTYILEKFIYYNALCFRNEISYIKNTRVKK